MIEAIGSLDANLYWLTSWAANANAVICPFVGWPPLPTLKKRTVGGWWKVELVREFLTSAPYEHVVWVDDDLDHFSEDIDVAVGRYVKARSLRLVCPNRETGLTAADIDAIGSLLSAAKH